MRVRGHSSGFTLIEILVVVALIGLLVTFAVLSIDRDPGQVAELEAKRFVALVEHARDESLLTGRPYAVEFDESIPGYRFLEPGQPWRPIEKDDVLKPRRLPEGVAMHIDVRQSGKSGQMIVVDGLGSITPFSLSLTTQSKRYTVIIDDAQNLKISDDGPGNGPGDGPGNGKS